MDDARKKRPVQQRLVDVASTQHEFFTAAQAGVCGFGTDLLPYHTRPGRFVRVHQGVYRLRDYPSFEQEAVVAAWLAIGREAAVVSHGSAFALLELAHVVPSVVHLSVPRSHRYLPTLAHVRLHTTTRRLERADVVERHGLPVTAPIRTVLDAAAAGNCREQIETAIRRAMLRNLFLPDELSAAANERSRRVKAFVDRALPACAIDA